MQQLADIFEGIRPTAVRFTAWSSLTTASLRVANRTTGGPIAEFLNHDLTQTVLLIDESGINHGNIGGYLDWSAQVSDPAGPAIGSGLIRMWTRAGQFWFRLPGGSPQQIPVGAPPGPSLRYAYWIG